MSLPHRTVRCTRCTGCTDTPTAWPTANMTRRQPTSRTRSSPGTRRAGEVLASALCCLPTTADETVSAVVDGIDMTLCVLPDGTLAISACPSNTTLVTPDLSRVVATYDAKDHRRAVPASSQRPHPTPGEERDHHRRCWVAAIQAAYESASRRDNQLVLVAHSLGCWAAAYWLEQARPDTVAASWSRLPIPRGRRSRVGPHRRSWACPLALCRARA